jgi:hypothetical protein
VLLEQAQALHDPGEGGPALLVPAIDIMEMGRAIEAEADEEVVFLKKLAPVIVQQGTVGLYGVFKDHGGFFVLLLIGDGLAVEIEAHEGGFAPLPGHGDLGSLMVLDELADVGFQDFFTHAKMAAGVEAVFVQKKAIGAVQIADGAGGLGQDMYAGRYRINVHDKFLKMVHDLTIFLKPKRQGDSEGLPIEKVDNVGFVRGITLVNVSILSILTS